MGNTGLGNIHIRAREVGIQFSSVQSLNRLGPRGDTRDDSAEILFHSFLQTVHVSNSVFDRGVHSLVLSIGIHGWTILSSKRTSMGTFGQYSLKCKHTGMAGHILVRV